MPARSKLSRYGTIFTLGIRAMLGQGTLYIVTWAFTTLVLAGVIMALYTAAYQASPQSLPLASAVWSLAIATFLRLTWRHLSGIVTNDVRSGDIALRMRYPLSYFSHVVVDHFGGAVPTLISVPLLCLMAFLVGGFPQIPSSHIAIPIAILMTVGSMALSAMIYMLMGLLAFWMEDPLPVVRIVEKIAVVLGGSVLPLALLPGAARHIIEYVPFAATGFPAQVTSPDFLTHVPRLLAIEFSWVLVIGVVLAVVWQRAQRRIEVNGG